MLQIHVQLFSRQVSYLNNFNEKDAYILNINYFICFYFSYFVIVPNEPLKGPGFAKFPESQTVHENQPVTFTVETEKDADKGNKYNLSKFYYIFNPC